MGDRTSILYPFTYSDLILLDVMLPDLNGNEVVLHLKHNPTTENIPVIAVTALASEEDRDRLLAAGCSGYLSKPYMIEDLEAIVCRALVKI